MPELLLAISHQAACGVRIPAAHDNNNIMTMKEIRTVTENWTAELKSMKVGDVLAFPLEKYSSISTILARLRLEMTAQAADWKPIKIDKERMLYFVKRTA